MYATARTNALRPANRSDAHLVVEERGHGRRRAADYFHVVLFTALMGGVPAGMTVLGALVN
jgi:hypothetical protein